MTAASADSEPAANLILIGPMGAGKTTIGRRLAALYRREFVDSDDEIERRTGVDIPLIFELEGEDGFRRRERDAIFDLCGRRGVVLATGGGAVLDPNNRHRLAAAGFVVYLQTSVDEQLRRLHFDSGRPLLKTADPRARLTELLTLRDPLYREIADLIVDTGCGNVKQAMKRIAAGCPLQ